MAVELLVPQILVDPFPGVKGADEDRRGWNYIRDMHNGQDKGVRSESWK
jgi:hypothetical protein